MNEFGLRVEWCILVEYGDGTGRTDCRAVVFVQQHFVGWTYDVVEVMPRIVGLQWRSRIGRLASVGG